MLERRDELRRQTPVGDQNHSDHRDSFCLDRRCRFSHARRTWRAWTGEIAVRNAVDMPAVRRAMPPGARPR